MVCIALYSDLHLEFSAGTEWFPDIPDKAEVVALVGDVHVSDGTANWVAKLANRYPDKQFLVVAGNHEFYGQDYDEQVSRFRRLFKQIPNAHFLQHDEFFLQGTRFLGCTLWSDFSALEPILGKQEAQQQASLRMNDFIMINLNGRPMTPQGMERLHLESVNWLEQRLSVAFNGPTVVLTHFPPVRTLSTEARTGVEAATYYTNPLEWLVEKYSPDLWLYGHNHWSGEYRLAGCRFVSNQRGYPGESRSRDRFQECLLITQDAFDSKVISD